MSVFTGILYFLILISVLVFIHEGGHFLMAKLFKVKVFVFSLGMGPRLFGFKKGDTDYRISAVPIGGYVRMLGEDPSEEIDEDEIAQSMQGISAPKRALIYAAGPAMNLIFPFFLYFFLFLGEPTVPPAEIGMVVEGTPAQKADLHSGDIIKEIDGQKVFSFSHLVDIVGGNANREIILTIDRQGTLVTKKIIPATWSGPKYQIPMLGHIKTKRGQMGVIGIYANSIVGVDSNSAAGRAGLETFDKIESINSIKVQRLIDVENILKQNAGRQVTVIARSLKQHIPKQFFPNAVEAQKINPAKQPPLFTEDQKTVQFTVPPNFRHVEDMGLHNSMRYVVHVDKPGPAYKAGLRKGDQLLQLDGKKRTSYEILSSLGQLNSARNDTVIHKLSWMRDGRIMSGQYKAQYIPAGTKRDLGVADDIINYGFYLRPYSSEWFGIVPEPVKNPAPIAYAAQMSMTQTLFWSRVIIDVLVSVLTGNISPKSFSGPIGIGHAAAQVGQEGISAFLGFMGFISLNLGLMNLLLPIPILDGGRLLIVGVEVVMRRKLSNFIQEKIMLAGAIMILMLMVWAVIMDIARIFVS